MNREPSFKTPCIHSFIHSLANDVVLPCCRAPVRKRQLFEGCVWLPHPTPAAFCHFQPKNDNFPSFMAETLWLWVLTCSRPYCPMNKLVLKTQSFRF